MSVLLPYEFLLEQNEMKCKKLEAQVLLPYEFLLEQNWVGVISFAFDSFVTI